MPIAQTASRIGVSVPGVQDPWGNSAEQDPGCRSRLARRSEPPHPVPGRSASFFERDVQPLHGPSHRRHTHPTPPPRLPVHTVFGQGGVRMCGELRTEGRFIGGTNQAGPPWTVARSMGPGPGALATPAADCGWIDPEHDGDVSHTVSVVYGGQGSFTDVVCSVWALHLSPSQTRT